MPIRDTDVSCDLFNIRAIKLCLHKRELLTHGEARGQHVTLRQIEQAEQREVGTWHVSHETIYRSLFLQARGTLKRELTAQRPPGVADRAIPGHWEGNRLSGAKNTHIATLVERTSRYVQLVRVAGKDTTPSRRPSSAKCSNCPTV